MVSCNFMHLCCVMTPCFLLFGASSHIPPLKWIFHCGLPVVIMLSKQEASSWDCLPWHMETCPLFKIPLVHSHMVLIMYKDEYKSVNLHILTKKRWFLFTKHLQIHQVCTDMKQFFSPPLRLYSRWLILHGRQSTTQFAANSACEVGLCAAEPRAVGRSTPSQSIAWPTRLRMHSGETWPFFLDSSLPLVYGHCSSASSSAASSHLRQNVSLYSYSWCSNYLATPSLFKVKSLFLFWMLVCAFLHSMQTSAWGGRGWPS